MDKQPQEIIYVSNASVQDTFANISSDLDKEVWRFGTTSATYGWDIEDPKPLFWCDFIKNRWHEILMHNVIDRLEQIDPKYKNYVFKLINAQAGGRVFGLDGSIHVDHDFEFNLDGDGFMTFCFFPNKEWQAEWGGELQFFNDEGQIIASFSPQPNTCVVFDSNIPHRGLAPTRDCQNFRKYVSLKVQVHKMWNTTGSVNFKDIEKLEGDQNVNQSTS